MRNIEELGEAGPLLAEVLTFTVTLDGERTQWTLHLFIFTSSSVRKCHGYDEFSQFDPITQQIGAFFSVPLAFLSSFFFFWKLLLPSTALNRLLVEI